MTSFTDKKPKVPPVSRRGRLRNSDHTVKMMSLIKYKSRGRINNLFLWTFPEVCTVQQLYRKLFNFSGKPQSHDCISCYKKTGQSMQCSSNIKQKTWLLDKLCLASKFSETCSSLIISHDIMKVSFRNADLCLLKIREIFFTKNGNAWQTELTLTRLPFSS